MFKLFGLALLALIFSTTSANAHKVILAVYQSGDVVEGELGFSNGDMAADTRIEVFDEQGNKLGETTTDADGYFIFSPTANVTHVFRAELGSGHIGEAILTAENLPGAVAEVTTTVPDAASVEVTPSIAQPAGIDEAALAEMLRNELRPLRREIAAYKEKNDLQTILGGIGYIVGLFGFFMYWSAHRKLKDAAS